MRAGLLRCSMTLTMDPRWPVRVPFSRPGGAPRAGAPAQDGLGFDSAVGVADVPVDAVPVAVGLAQGRQGWSMFAAADAAFDSCHDRLRHRHALGKLGLRQAGAGAGAQQLFGKGCTILGKTYTQGVSIGTIDVMKGYKLVADVDEFYLDKIKMNQKGTVEFNGKTLDIRN